MKTTSAFLCITLLGISAPLTLAQVILHSEDFESYSDGQLVEGQNGWSRAMFDSGTHGTPIEMAVLAGASHDGSAAAGGNSGSPVGRSAGKLIEPGWIDNDTVTVIGDFKVDSGWVRFQAGPQTTVLTTEDYGNVSNIWLNFDNRGHFTEARFWNNLKKDHGDAGFEVNIIPTSLTTPGAGIVSSTGWAQWRFQYDVSGTETNGHYTIEMRPLNNSTDNSSVPWTMLRNFTGSGLNGVTFDAFSIHGQAPVWAWDNIQIVGSSSASFAGDFDGDGDVDGDDFLVWQNGMPTASGAAKSGGDADGDGDVDGDDFLIWQNQFPSSGAVATTPEPASLALLGLGGLMMLRRCNA